MRHCTTYTKNETTYHAVQIPWWETEEILERTHCGYPEDDEELKRYLLLSGYPMWIRSAEEGWVDENGWGLIGPEKAGGE